MNKKNVLLCSGALALALQAGAVQAGPAPLASAADEPSRLAVGFQTLLELSQALRNWTLPKPRGMVVCADSWSQDLCRVGLGNGDFEDPNDPETLSGWSLKEGRYSPAPYLGSTPTSRVLALQGQGAEAVTGAFLPLGSTISSAPQNTYTVKLRARGSGPLPADVDVALFVGSEASESVRELASVSRTVGWDWENIDFKVDGISSPAPAVLLVGIKRRDNNTPTMLQVDDVRIVRTRLGVTPPAE
ncbi:hypothetical protein C8J98_110120 [Luteibacter sp. OK325]|uniref:hypothetical protein n=1 Tax=Luteibacter sp. OK325 TaxID=2135670 RepID=UPI000D357891|nr:hypothetical protein [Luteibacter sp. OK325]PTR26390.1 hypothetical protein C8J98_110120 [Luteibacter sp. OK325]